MLATARVLLGPIVAALRFDEVVAARLALALAVARREDPALFRSSLGVTVRLLLEAGLLPGAVRREDGVWILSPADLVAAALT